MPLPNKIWGCLWASVLLVSNLSIPHKIKFVKVLGNKNFGSGGSIFVIFGHFQAFGDRGMVVKHYFSELAGGLFP